MRLLVTAVLLVAASPAIAGPLDTVQYRTTLRTDQVIMPWPASPSTQTAYLMGDAPKFGVVVESSPDWSTPSPIHPGASIATFSTGGFLPFTSAKSVDSLNVFGSGRYAMDVELQDATGRVGVVSFSGRFEAGWWGGHGFAWLVFDTIPSPDGAGAPPQPVNPSGSVWLGRTRYDVRLENGWPPFYGQNEDGSWSVIGLPADPVSSRAGGYWTEGAGNFYVTLTPVQTPEPSTLALAAVGTCGAWVARRRRGQRRTVKRQHGASGIFAK